ncbi:MAG: peptidoglycan-binding protein [Actinomycetota bacterium]
MTITPAVTNSGRSSRGMGWGGVLGGAVTWSAIASRVATDGRRLASLVGLLLVGSVGLGGGSVVFADQDVVFDGAGDAARVSVIGDSTLAGVRWYADYGALERFNFVLSAESCRRTIELSCISREGYRSENVIGAMRSLDGQLGEVLVVMSGYNDPIWTIDEAIDGVVEEARSQGVGHVVWLTLRSGDDVDYSDPQEQSSTATFRAFNEQLVDAAEASGGFLQVADWATYSLGASAWFEQDGVHLTPAGVDALTTFIASVIERVLAGDDVSPAAAPWTVLVPGAEGDIVATVQQAVIDAGVDLAGGADGVYGNDTMAAVAEYQRRTGDLQVTGAVDLATARALGVTENAEETTSSAPVNVVGQAVPPTSPPSDAPASGDPTDESFDGPHDAETDGDSISTQAIIAAAGAGLIGAIALRRRHVVRRRAGRARRVGAPNGTVGRSRSSPTDRADTASLERLTGSSRQR